MTITALMIAALFALYSLVRAEFDKYELKKTITQLEAENHALRRRPSLIPAVPQGEDEHTLTTQAVRRGRPGRFQSFGAAKRILENQPAPQRSVNV